MNISLVNIRNRNVLSDFATFFFVFSRIIFLWAIFYFSTSNYSNTENAEFDYLNSIVTIFSLLFTFSFDKLVIYQKYYLIRERLSGVMNSLHFFTFFLALGISSFLFFKELDYVLTIISVILLTSYNQFYFALLLRDNNILYANLYRFVLNGILFVLIFFAERHHMSLILAAMLSQLSVAIVFFFVYSKLRFISLMLSLNFLKSNFSLICQWYLNAVLDALKLFLLFAIVKEKMSILDFSGFTKALSIFGILNLVLASTLIPKYLNGAFYFSNIPTHNGRKYLSNFKSILVIMAIIIAFIQFSKPIIIFCFGHNWIVLFYQLKLFLPFFSTLVFSFFLDNIAIIMNKTSILTIKKAMRMILCVVFFYSFKLEMAIWLYFISFIFMEILINFYLTKDERKFG